MRWWIGFTRLCLRCGFWLLLLLALLLLATRLLAPRADLLQPHLSDYLAQQLQTSVQMSNLRAGWHGAQPFFLIDDLSLGRDEAQLYLGTVRVYLRPGALLRRGRNALQMEVINARLALHRTATGWSLSGLSSPTGDSEIAAGARRQTLESVLSQGDLRLRDAQISISNAALPDERTTLWVDYADLSRFSDSAWRPALQQMARRPDALPRSAMPQWTAPSSDQGGYGVQLRLRPQASPDQTNNATASDAGRAAQAGVDVAMQLRFGPQGMAVEGYADLTQQPIDVWQQLLRTLSSDPEALVPAAAAAPQLKLSSSVWFGWREQDYLQLRGALALHDAAEHNTASAPQVLPLASDIEWLWQSPADGQAPYWQLLLHHLGKPDALPAAASLAAGSAGHGGWSARVEQLQPQQLAGLIAAFNALAPNQAVAQWQQQLQDWIKLQHADTRINLPELVVDDRHRIQAASLRIDELLLSHAVLADQSPADAGDGIDDCGPFALQLDMRQQLGRFRLTADQAVCALPGLLRSPLLLDHFSLAGPLEQLADGVRVDAAQAQLETPDFSMQAQWQLQQQTDRGSAELHLHMPTLLATRLKAYLPPDSGKPDTARWIEQAMQGGWLRDLRLSWPLAWGNNPVPAVADATDNKADGAPWDDLQLALELDDVRMDYARNWPPAESLQASMRIVDNRLQATTSQARMRDVSLTDVSARIDELFSHASLHLQANVAGDGEQMLDLLASMPITGGDFSKRDYRLRGPVQAQADIGIDLAGRTELLYARGAASLRGVQAVTEQITIDDIHGQLGFDDTGPTNSSLQGRWGEHDARLAWQRTPDGPEIRMQGRFPSQQVAHAAVDLPALIPQYIAGSSLWKLRLLLDRDTVMVLAYSDLLGTEIRLPAPLSKLATTRRPLSLSLPLGSGARSIRIRHGSKVAEFDQLEAGQRHADTGLLSVRLLQLDDGNVAAAAMHFDQPAADWRAPMQVSSKLYDAPLEPGQLRFSGHASAISALDWGGLLLDYRRDTAARPATAASSVSTAPGFTLSSDLRTDSLLLAQRNLGPVALSIAAADSAAASSDSSPALALQLQGDNIAGSADIVDTASGALVNVAMRRLYLPAPGPSLSNTPEPRPDMRSDPALPQDGRTGITVNLIADEVRYEQLDLGMVRLELVPTIDGLSLQRLEASSDSINVTATGAWQAEQGNVESRLELRLDSNDMGTVLRGLGYDDLVRNAQTTMLLDVNWAGDISQFRLHKLRGYLDVTTGRGVIPKASPGAGRALGLLSLQALPQRLFLDFSDVFAEGMEFENASGRFVFDDGMATAENVVINAAAATIRMTGSTDLVARTYDQRLLIEPARSFALPLIGVIAGGPIGAGAGFALQSLFSGPIGEISKLEYQITGPWQNPTLSAYSPEPTVTVNKP